MAQDYYTILTNAGLAYEAQQKAQNKPITLVAMAIGDGNGSAYNPDQAATTLRREVHRQAINSLLQDVNNPTWLVAEAWLADDVGGWTIREVGIYTDTGVLYAIAKYPESIKPLLASGSGKQFYVRTIFQTSNVANVVLQVDNAVVMATRAFVVDHVRDELAKLDSKQSVRVATTANVALTGLQTIDGVVLAAGDRVLVKDQAAAKDNGIYVAVGGAWARAADADTAAKLTPELCVGVEQGTVNGDSLWMLTTDAPITLGTTLLTFEIAGGRPLATKVWVQGLTASEASPGLIKLATPVQVQAGTDMGLAVTPQGLSTLSSTENRAGLVQLATAFQVMEGTDVSAVVTPAGLSARTATETRTGLVEIATQAEAESGTDDTRMMPAKKVLQLIRATAAQATEALRGALRIGTQAEVDAGTLDTVAITPKKLRWGFSVLLAATGYIAFPVWLGGPVLQWGTASTAGGSLSKLVTFPMNYPRGVFIVVATHGGYTSGQRDFPSTGGLSLGSFTLYSSVSDLGHHWFSVGY